MPIKKPGKRPFAPWLKEHKALVGGQGKRSPASDLLLTPLIDMFVILVVFLIMNFSSTGELPIAAGIILPKASVDLMREMATAIDITDRAVSVEGLEVGKVDELADEQDLRVAKLTEKLQDIRKLEEMSNPGEKFKGNIIINCHKDVDFKIVRKVMFAAAEAGFLNVNYAVLQTGQLGEEGAGEAAE